MANDWQQKKHCFELLKAAKSGDTAAVQAVIDAANASGWDRAAQSAGTERDEQGHTALMAAVLGGFGECVRILAPISPVNSQAKNGHTALMMAAQRGFTACARELLPFSKAQMRDRNDQDALAMALRAGHDECARLLFPVSIASSGGDPARLHAFRHAAVSHNAECMRLVLPDSREALLTLLSEWSAAPIREHWPEPFGVLEAECLRRETLAASGQSDENGAEKPVVRRAPRSL